MTPPDRIAAVVALLKDDPAVAAAAGDGRVFGHELPDFILGSMPTSCLVVKPAGGASSIGAGGYAQYSDSRVDVRHYGWKPDAAMALYTVVYAFLKAALPQSKAGCFLHWFRPSGGPVATREPAAPAPGIQPSDPSPNWPVVLASWQVLAADVLVGV